MAGASAESMGTIGADRTPRPGRLERVLAYFPDADRLTIAAVLLVVLLVSIPLLRTHSLRQNELDALRSLSVLAAALHSAAPGELAPTSIGELVNRNPDILRRLADTEVLDGGRLLRRHGYLFDLWPVVQVGPGVDSTPAALRAWPWARGRTGLGAFVLARPGEVLGHANRDSLFSGPHSPPGIPGERTQEWRRLPLTLEP